MVFKIYGMYDGMYNGDNGFAGQVEAPEYTKKVRWKLLAFVSRMMNFPGFCWQVADEDGRVIDGDGVNLEFEPIESEV